MPAERAPTLFAIGKGDTRTHCLNFAACLTAEVAVHLNDVAQDFLARHGIHDEPVQWQPPTAGDDPDAVDVDTLHRLVHESRCSITDAAQRLGTSLDVAGNELDEHPAPLTQDYATDKARNFLPKELLTRLYMIGEVEKDEREGTVDAG
jgi:hypothetical protein